MPQLQRIIRQLEAAGWKLSTANLTNTSDYYVHCHQGETELEIFHQRADRMSFSFPEKAETALEFIAHYRQPFSRAEREAALEKLLEEQCPIEKLLPFRNSFSAAQHAKFYALVEKTPITSPQVYVQLADVYLHRKETNAALTVLLRAKALAATIHDPSSLQSDIEAQAKKISPKQKLKLEVTPETCRELGFLEITNAPQTFEKEQANGQPLVLFGSGKRGVKIFALTIRPPQKGVYPWTMMQSEEGSRSTTSSSFSLTGGKNWQHTFTFDQLTLKVAAHPLPDQKRVKFTVQTER